MCLAGHPEGQIPITRYHGQKTQETVIQFLLDEVGDDLYNVSNRNVNTKVKETIRVINSTPVPYLRVPQRTIYLWIDHFVLFGEVPLITQKRINKFAGIVTCRAGSRQRTKEVRRRGDCRFRFHDIRISSLHIHPVKSLRPVLVQYRNLSHLGMEGDQTLMLVRPSLLASSTAPYHFFTQRQCPAFATINTSLPTVVPPSSSSSKDDGGSLRSTQEERTIIQLSDAKHEQKIFINVSPGHSSDILSGTTRACGKRLSKWSTWETRPHPYNPSS